MVVIFAFWIKNTTAIWAFVVAVKIFINGYFGFALSAQNCIGVPLILRP